MKLIGKRLILSALCMVAVNVHAETKNVSAIQALTCDTNAAVNTPNSCPYPFDVEAADPVFKKALASAMEKAGLGELWKEDGALRGPATPLEPVAIAGITWLSSTSCEAHNCSNHFINYLYQPALKGFVGLYHIDDKNFLIGNPDAAQVELLKRQ